MIIANIQIEKAIAHEVIRAADLENRPPIFSENLMELGDNGKTLISKRLISAVGSGSHCVDVTVDDAGERSPFDGATMMLDCDDKEFVNQSNLLAVALSEAQTIGSIKAGTVVFIVGTCSVDGEKSRFHAIIKADSDQGFYRQIRDHAITFEYVKDMLLGESQRLLKIAFFIEEVFRAPAEPRVPREPEDFSIKVFDSMMQNSGDGNAAAYFYRTFLKCRQADNAARKTRQFYETARDFINSLDLPQGDKVDLRVDMVAYFRGNLMTLEPRAFARSVLPQGTQDSFIRTCRDKGMSQAITKDLGLLKGKMRKQSVKFSSNVTIYAPPDVFRDAIDVGEIGEDGWTVVRIKGTAQVMA